MGCADFEDEGAGSNWLDWPGRCGFSPDIVDVSKHIFGDDCDWMWNSDSRQPSERTSLQGFNDTCESDTGEYFRKCELGNDYLRLDFQHYHCWVSVVELPSGSPTAKTIL